jgi:ATP-binding cassette, subfamily B, bacterial MsbA
MSGVAAFPLVAPAKWLWREARLVAWLVVLSIGLALSEGISVTLLIPALDSNVMTGFFANVPVLRTLAGWLLEVPESHRLLVIAALLAVGVSVRGLMQFGSQYLAALIPLRLQCAIMERSYDALVDADFAYMPEHNRGELHAIVHDHPQRAAAVINGLLTFVVSAGLIAVFGLLMILISWQMTLASVAFLAIAHLTMRRLSRPWFAWAGERLSQVMAQLNASVAETIYGLVLIKLRVAEPIMKARFVETAAKFRHVETRRYFFSELQSPVLITISGLFVCALLVLSLTIHGSSDRSWTGLFILFIICLYRLVGPASRMITAQGIIASNFHAFAAIEAFVAQARRSRLASGARPIKRLNEGVRFERAGLTYEEGRGPALDGVDIEIGRGEVDALVGTSGAGKTSVLTLLMRLRDPTAGRVVVDGHDLRDYDLSQWRRRISSVTQDIVLFNDTVRRNLCFGLGQISDAEIWNALRDASADDFVKQLPGGLEASLGDAGLKLSGGQRQRLALARALLADPDILVLDEATSHLDSITEASIQRTIDTSRGKRTVVIVAHRLSTVREADRIYVLEQGRVLEQGTHGELCVAGGGYSRLFEAQDAHTPGNQS